jgi:MFS family permease
MERGYGDFRYEWRTLFACLVGHTVGVHALPAYTIGLFVAPLQEEFGWSRTSISFGITILTIGTAASAPIAGAAVNRLGERVIIAAGLIALSGCYLVLSAMGASIGVYWVVMAVMAAIGVGCSPVTLSRIVVASFDRNRGVALGITLVGTGLPAAFGPLVLTPIIAARGWRAGYIALFLMMLVSLPVIVGLLALNGIGGRSPNGRNRADGAAPIGFVEMLRQPMLFRVLAPFFAVAVATGGVVVHFVSMLLDVGYAPKQAGEMTSLLGVSLIAGRVLTGVAIDRLFAPHVAAGLMGASAAGFLLLWFDGASHLLPFASVLVGMSLGAEIDLIAYLASRYFLATHYGRIFGLLYSTFLVGVAISPVIFAWLRDAVGTYSPSFLWATTFLAISTWLFATLPRFPALNRVLTEHENQRRAHALPRRQQLNG